MNAPNNAMELTTSRRTTLLSLPISFHPLRSAPLLVVAHLVLVRPISRQTEVKALATAQSFATSSGSPYRFAGRAAIVSGIIGIVAYGFLWAFLVKRISGASEQICIPLIRTHDAGVILQISCSTIPVALALYRIGRQHSPGVSRGTVVVGVRSALAYRFLSVAHIINVLADEIYMIPQGVLGLWLILVSRSGSTVLSRSLRVLGTVVGIGLVLVATFPIGSLPPFLLLRASVRSLSIISRQRGRKQRMEFSISSFSSALCSWASQHIRFGPRWWAADCSAKEARDQVTGLTMRWSERRTALRSTFEMTSTLPPRATRALVRRRSSCSR